ncbi:hypothetical protein BJX66DRAFT_332167 [Aspergillus keveii]|uniref:N-acetyltransferase domain-containing protein n=1 Tax=Aspergillus keveii TaxID=714993 RepID=A0ABR4GNH2_9EURO
MALTLIPVNLNDPVEYEELRQQRITCGWDNTVQILSLWQEKQAQGLKSLFWVTELLPDSKSPFPIRAGHISLDAYASPIDYDLANANKTNLTIQTFFILPEYRSRGLGSRAIKLIEGMARSAPYGSSECKYITLNCMSKKYYFDETMGPYVRRFMPICNQQWYEKLGYVAWKEEPRYEHTIIEENEERRDVVYDAVFMRKRLER